MNLVFHMSEDGSEIGSEPSGLTAVSCSLDGLKW